MAFLTTAWSWITSGLSSVPWAAIGLIAALGGAVTYGVHYIHENDSLSCQLNDSKTQHVDDLAAMGFLKNQSSIDLQFVADIDDLGSKSAVAESKQTEEIKNAPKTSDGDVAPVLSGAIDSLRNAGSPDAGH